MKFLKNLISKKSLKNRGALLIGATMASNFFNLLFNAYLGRSIDIEDFAVISFIGSILSLSDIPIGALGRAVTYKSAFLLGKYNKPAERFWKNLRRRALIVSIFLTAAWLISASFLVKFFHLDDIYSVLAFTPVWVLTIISSVDGGYLNGNLRFGYLGIVFALEALSKFLIAVLLINLGLGEYAYLAIVLSVFVSFGLIVTASRKIKAKKVKVSAAQNSFPGKFYISSIMSRISTVVYLSADVILAKHFLSAEQAGQYALLSLSGKMVFFAGSLFSQFILPMISHKDGTGKNSLSLFYKLLGATALSSIMAFLVVGAFGKITMPLIFSSKANGILNYLFMYSLSMVAFTVSTSIVAFNQIKGKHILPAASFLIAVAQIFAISLFSSSIGQISLVVSIMGFASLLITSLLHFYSRFVDTLILNIKDFLGAFAPIKKSKAKGLRILIYNWRDTKHMWAGGAEVYVHELAKRWVEKGNSVTLFCGNDHKNLRNETIDGVNIIRRGGFYTVYVWAVLYYLLKFRKHYDIVVDSENGIPFFTPLFSTKPIILLIHHVHQDIFITHMRFPFSYVGRFIEGKLMPFVYRSRAVVTVSESSKKEIVKAKIAKEDNIQIVNPGIEMPQKIYRKADMPTLVYLGRLKAYKNIDVAIRAFAQIAKRVPKARFWVVGEGESIGSLKDLALKLGIEKKVIFYGKVENDKKVELLSKSWVAVQPSTVEGWGITVLEANACKTPVVASDTNGLRDSVVNNKTGVLVKVKDVKGFSKGIRTFLNNPALRKKASKEAYSWASKFSWDQSSEKFYQVALSEVSKKNSVFSLERATYLLNRVTSLF